MARDGNIRTADLGLESSGPSTADFDRLQLADAERLLIQKALERHAGNVSAAAADLGLSRSALYRRLEKHNLG